MIRLAAEVADGLLISRRGGSSPRYVRGVLNAVAAVPGKRDGFRVRCFFETAVDTDRRVALDAMRRVFTSYSLPHLHRGVLEATEVAWSEIEPLVAAVRGGDPEVGARIPESVLDRLSVVGTPEECLRKLAAFEGLAIDAPILYLHGHDPRRALALAAQLLPALREFH
jgi:alkanesulfonate monooxygenase SsuD/methylene tetrahydromethanopterin reductase-like flavin-dependent oxidoreductase (luciferase family)